MAAPVESLPICSCPWCDEARRQLGPTLLACDLLPGPQADFLADVVGALTRKYKRALDELSIEFALTRGVRLQDIEGYQAVLAAVSMLPVIDGGYDRDKVVALARAILDIANRYDAKRGGHN